VPANWSGFDLAFSHEVLYLLDDLPAHAEAVFAALAPGGVYFAVIGVHTGSPLMADWHRENAEALKLPKLYDIDEVIADFQAAGFEAAASRLAMRFVPTGGSHHGGPDRMLEWLDYYYEQKLLL